jgi:hypothetical protein
MRPRYGDDAPWSTVKYSLSETLPLLSCLASVQVWPLFVDR